MKSKSAPKFKYSTKLPPQRDSTKTLIKPHDMTLPLLHNIQQLVHKYSKNTPLKRQKTQPKTRSNNFHTPLKNNHHTPYPNDFFSSNKQISPGSSDFMSLKTILHDKINQQEQIHNLSFQWKLTQFLQSKLLDTIESTLHVVNQITNQEDSTEPKSLTLLNQQLAQLMSQLSTINHQRNQINVKIDSLEDLGDQMKAFDIQQELLANYIIQLVQKVKGINEAVIWQQDEQNQNKMRNMREKIRELESENKELKHLNLNEEEGEKKEKKTEQLEKKKSKSKKQVKEKTELKSRIMLMQQKINEMSSKEKRLINLVSAVKQRGIDVELIYENMDEQDIDESILEKNRVQSIQQPPVSNQSHHADYSSLHLHSQQSSMTKRPKTKHKSYLIE